MTSIPIAHSKGKLLSLQFQEKQSKVIDKQIAIPSQGKIDLIDVNTIIYLKSDSNYTRIHLEDGKTILSAITLKRYADKLSADHFLRVHQSYLIRKSCLSRYLIKEKKLILQNSKEIPVSNSKREGLLDYLKAIMV